jgi:hypothetical protein
MICVRIKQIFHQRCMPMRRCHMQGSPPIGISNRNICFALNQVSRDSTLATDSCTMEWAPLLRRFATFIYIMSGRAIY